MTFIRAHCVLFLWMFSIPLLAQPIVPSTPFTREFLRSTNASEARGKIGAYGTNSVVGEEATFGKATITNLSVSSLTNTGNTTLGGQTIAHGAILASNQFIKSGEILLRPRQASSALVTFAWDDGYESDATNVMPLFNAFGYVGVSCITISNIGTAGKMTWDQVRNQQTNGWEIAAHSLTHKDYSTNTEAVLRSDMGGTLSALSANGVTNAYHLACPFNYNSSTNRRIAADYFRSCRGGTYGLNSGTLSTFGLSQMPLSTDVSSNAWWVASAVSNSAWLVFYCHEWQETNILGQVLAYCQSNNVPVVTMQQGLYRIGNAIDVGDTLAAGIGGIKSLKPISLGIDPGLRTTVGFYASNNVATALELQNASVGIKFSVTGGTNYLQTFSNEVYGSSAPFRITGYSGIPELLCLLGGKVGIGTNGPQRDLHVASSPGTTSATWLLLDNANGRALGIGSSGSAYSLGANQFVFYDFSSTALANVRLGALTASTFFCPSNTIAATNTAGIPGQMFVDAGYIYWCDFTNHWNRIAKDTW